MSPSRPLFLGMDVHKDAIAVAYVAQDHGAEVPYLGSLGTRQCDLDPLLRKMQSQACVFHGFLPPSPEEGWLLATFREAGGVNQNLAHFMDCSPAHASTNRAKIAVFPSS